MIFDLFTEKVVSFDPLLTTFSDGSRLSDYLVDLSCFQDVSKRTTVLDSFVSLGFFVVELDDSLKQVLANNHYLKTKQFKEGITYNAILFVLPKKIMDVRQKFKEVITISGKP
ncbi:TPA: hypothetical protein DEP21_00070, partial [Patescibacteria group bacterium]|nr:hypothetical protein [Candidatus Gracilibacteria bacterium]